MAIAFDAVTYNLDTTNDTGQSFSATIGGTADFLVAIMHNGDGAASYSSTTWNGVAMTEAYDASVGVVGRFAIAWLTAPATGTQTFSTTLSASRTDKKVWVLSYSGVKQASPIDGSVGVDSTNSGTVIDPGDSTTLSTSWVVGAAVRGDSAGTFNTFDGTNRSQPTSQETAGDSNGAHNGTSFRFGKSQAGNTSIGGVSIGFFAVPSSGNALEIGHFA